MNFSKSIAILLLVILLAAGNAFAADLEATLDSADSTSGFNVINSSGTSVFKAAGDGTVTIGTGLAGHQKTLNATAKTSAYTLTASDGVILADSSGGAFTITYPTASGITGRIYTVILSVAGNMLTLAPNGSETINSSTTTTLSTAGDFITAASDGTNWRIIAQSAATGVATITGSETFTNKTLASPTISGGGSFSGTFSGTPTLSGTVAFTGTPTFSGIDVNSGAVDGATIGATNPSTGAFTTLSTTGAATLGAALSASGATTLSSTLAVTGDTSLGGIAAVTGTLTMGSTLVVTGDTSVDGTSSVVGATTLASSLDVTGATTFDGTLTVGNGATSGGKITLLEDSDSGTKSISLLAPTTLAADLTFTLPTADGSSGQSLNTDGSGTLSWGSSSGSAFTRTVLVTPSGGDYTTVSAAVTDLATWCPSPSSTSQCLISVGPGTYSSESFSTTAYVDIEGSGQEVTVLDGAAITSSASNWEIRNLKLSSTGNILTSTGGGGSIRNVTMESLGTQVTINGSGGPTFRNIILNTTSSTPSILNFSSGTSSFYNMQITVTGTTTSVIQALQSGVFNIYDSVITGGGSSATGLTTGGGSTGTTNLYNTRFDVSAIASGSAIIVASASHTVNVFDSTLTGGSSGEGIEQSAGTANVSNSLVTPVNATGTITCVGAYSSTYVALGTDCR